MRDPDWLIEENRLENLSRLTVSNSSVCLTEIRKMLETGTSGEEVLDTLVTNVGSQQQKASAADRPTMISRYCSEAVLPTYIDFDGARLSYGHVSEANTIDIAHRLPDEFVCTMPNCSTATVDGHSQRIRTHLASMETLNESDKYSCASDSHGSLDKMFLVSDAAKLHKSTQSLDERKLYMDAIRGPSSIKGSSMDAILENGGVAPLDDICMTVYAPLFNRFRTDEMMVNAQRPNYQSNNNGKSGQPHRHHHGHRHLNGGVPTVDLHLRKSFPLPRNSHHFQHMRLHRKGMNYRNAMLNTHRYRLKASSCPNIYRNSMTTLAKEEEDVR